MNTNNTPDWAWKQHVKDMEKYAFKDPKKYHDAFYELITQTLEAERQRLRDEVEGLRQYAPYLGQSGAEQPVDNEYNSALDAVLQKLA